MTLRKPFFNIKFYTIFESSLLIGIYIFNTGKEILSFCWIIIK